MKNNPILQEVKDNLSISLPLVSAWLIYSLGPFAGTAFLGYWGKDYLAASVLINTVWIAGLTFWFGIFHGVSVLVSHNYGAKNFEVISNIINENLILLIIASISLACLLLMMPLYTHYSAPNSKVMLLANSYAKTLALAAPSIIALGWLEHFLSAIGKARLSLWISLIEIPLEIMFIYIFMFGKLGLPAMGIVGIALGLVVTYTLTIIGVLIYLSSAKFMRVYRASLQFTWKQWGYNKEVLKIGLPVGLTYFLELMGFTVATYLISTFSVLALAAQQLVMQFLGVIINVPYAIGQAITIRIGFALGKNDPQAVKNAGWVGLFLGTVISLIISCLLIVFAKPLIAIDLDLNDTKNSDLITLTIQILFIISFYQFMDGLRIYAASILRGFKETYYAMVVNVICFTILGTLGAYIIGIQLKYNLQGIWYGLTLGIVLASLILLAKACVKLLGLHKKLNAHFAK